MKSKIYICYSESSLSQIKDISNYLINKGYEVKYVEHYSKELMIDPAEEMLSGINWCDSVLFLHKKDANESSMVSTELTYIFNQNKDVFIAKLDNSTVDKSLEFTLSRAKLAKEKGYVNTLNALIEKGL